MCWSQRRTAFQRMPSQALKGTPQQRTIELSSWWPTADRPKLAAPNGGPAAPRPRHRADGQTPLRSRARTSRGHRSCLEPAPGKTLSFCHGCLHPSDFKSCLTPLSPRAFIGQPRCSFPSTKAYFRASYFGSGAATWRSGHGGVIDQFKLWLSTLLSVLFQGRGSAPAPVVARQATWTLARPSN